MNTQEILHIVQFAVPMYIALICGLLFFRMYRKNESPLGRKNIKWVIAACALSFFGWFSMNLYLALPKVFAALNPLVLLIFVLVHVMYYRFVFQLTSINSDEKFPLVHFLIPLFGFVVMLIWSLFVPFDVQVSLVESRGVWVEEYKYYSIFFTSKPLLFFIYDIMYAFLGLRRAMRFRKVVVNYSADEQRISFVWLYQFLFIMLAGIPMTVAALFLPKYIIISSGIALLPIIIAMLKEIILAHNVLLENYVIIKSDTPQQQIDSEKLSETFEEKDIDRLKTYMREKKPYLNQRLKITDMTVGLNMNRTALSMLINKTYGMNFNRFINRYRLEELERIKSNAAYKELDELEIVARAGFSDYRGYWRVKQREEEEVGLWG